MSHNECMASIPLDRPPSSPAPDHAPYELATLGGGCFWCLEAVYELLRGVVSVESGYAGGDTPNPTYEQVCSGLTGHAEVVQVRFDPLVISYRDLLEVFFTIHDPTTPNRQGHDVGTQYRSIILTHAKEQAEEAQVTIEALATLWDRPVVTEVASLGVFYPAEEYHRAYYRRNMAQPYCQLVVAPKVAKARAVFLDRLVR